MPIRGGISRGTSRYLYIKSHTLKVCSYVSDNKLLYIILGKEKIKVDGEAGYIVVEDPTRK